MNRSIDQAIFAFLKNGLRVLLILFITSGFLSVGMVKLVKFPTMVDYFNVWNIPIWAMQLIGILEIVLAILIYYKPTRIKGLMLSCGLMIGATSVHLYFKEYSYAIVPSVLFLLCVILIIIEKYKEK